MLERLKAGARRLRRDATALFLAMKDRRTPLHVRVIAGLVAGYALSPIDLIPDFIPVIGLLDDLIIVPLGVMLVVRLMPDGLMDEFRAEAETLFSERPPQVAVAGVVVVMIWAALVGWAAYALFCPLYGGATP